MTVSISDVVTRLNAQVPALAGRIEGAAQLAALVKEGALPNVTPAAFVLPLGLQGNPGDAVTGMFRQMIGDTIAVVLVISVAGDVTGAASQPEVDMLRDAVIAAVAGWAPGNQVGVFE